MLHLSVNDSQDHGSLDSSNRPLLIGDLSVGSLSTTNALEMIYRALISRGGLLHETYILHNFDTRLEAKDYKQNLTVQFLISFEFCSNELIIVRG